MIADALKIEIEAHARRVRAVNPLLLQAAAGALPPEAIGRYLVSLKYVIGRTPACLALARDCARASERHVLAEYYAEKLGEEDGHEAWADHDIAVFGRLDPLVATAGPVDAAVELIDFLKRTIRADPTLYLAYVLWAEYFTVLAGGELVEYLVTRCKVPTEALTCLANHVVLDQEHSDENLEVIDSLVENPRMLAPMRAVLHAATSMFDRMCEQIVEIEQPAAATPVRHVG